MKSYELTIWSPNSDSFSQSLDGLIPDLHPETLLGCVEGQWLQWLVTSSLENQVGSNNFSWHCGDSLY